MLVETEGIILQADISGESDICAKIITENYGIQSYIFKGLRKSRTRPQSAAEPGMRSLISYRETRSGRYHTVQDITPLDLHEGIRSSMEKIVCMHFLVETTLKTAGQNTPDPFLYKMLKAAIETVEKDGIGPELPLFFTTRLLSHHGLIPLQAVCSHCGKDSVQLYFSFTEHTLLCSGCSVYPGVPLSPAQSGFLSRAQISRFSALNPFPLAPHDTKMLLKNLIHFMEQYFSIEIKSKTLLYSLII